MSTRFAISPPRVCLCCSQAALGSSTDDVADSKPAPKTAKPDLKKATKPDVKKAKPAPAAGTWLMPRLLRRGEHGAQLKTACAPSFSRQAFCHRRQQSRGWLPDAKAEESRAGTAQATGSSLGVELFFLFSSSFSLSLFPCCSLQLQTDQAAPEPKAKEPRKSADAGAPNLKPSHIRASMKKKKVRELRCCATTLLLCTHLPVTGQPRFLCPSPLTNVVHMADGLDQLGRQRQQ